MRAANLVFWNVMPFRTLNEPVLRLSKVELFPRRNSAAFPAFVRLSKVELFLRRSSTAGSFSSVYFLLLLPLRLLLFSAAGEGVTQV